MTDIGIKQVAERIHNRLKRYLEAQYHIKDPALIGERHLLLLEPGAIGRRTEEHLAKVFMDGRIVVDEEDPIVQREIHDESGEAARGSSKMKVAP